MKLRHWIFTFITLVPSTFALAMEYTPGPSNFDPNSNFYAEESEDGYEDNHEECKFVYDDVYEYNDSGFTLEEELFLDVQFAILHSLDRRAGNTYSKVHKPCHVQKKRKIKRVQVIWK